MLTPASLERLIREHHARSGLTAPYDDQPQLTAPAVPGPVNENPDTCDRIAATFARLAYGRVIPTCIEGWTVVSQVDASGVYRELLIARPRNGKPAEAVFINLPADPRYMCDAIEYALQAPALPLDRPPTSHLERHGSGYLWWLVVVPIAAVIAIALILLLI